MQKRLYRQPAHLVKGRKFDLGSVSVGKDMNVPCKDHLSPTAIAYLKVAPSTYETKKAFILC